MNDKKKETPQGEAAFIADAAGLPAPGARGQEPQPAPVDYRNFVVDFTQPAPEPHFLLEIDGVGVMPADGITAVTGKAKQGKTQFLAAVVSCLISGRDFGRMKRREAPGHILWVDTEQSKYNICNTIGRVYNLAGIPEGQPSEKHGLTVLEVSTLEAEERRAVIENALCSLKPEMLVIDGLRDLISDFNDNGETGEIMTWLKNAMAVRPGMRAAAVLHTNPGNDKMRGALGTELTHKFSDKFLCSKENGIFSVTHECRNREILTPFIFCIDGHGNLSTSTVEQRAGIVSADEALIKAIPFEGASWFDAVKAYAKQTGLTQAKARDALKARLNSNPPTLIKHEGLFYRTGAATGAAPARSEHSPSAEDVRAIIERIKDHPATGAAEKLPFENNSEGDNCPF